MKGWQVQTCQPFIALAESETGQPGRVAAAGLYAAAPEQWHRAPTGDKKTDLIPPGWFDACADATWATDPVGAKENPPMLRAPNLTA